MARKHFENLRGWSATASAICIIAIGLVGLAYDALHRMKLAWIAGAQPEEALIFLVCFICFGVGAERLLTLRNIENNMQTAQKQRSVLAKKTELIAHDVGIIAGQIKRIEALDGLEEIEAAATKLIKDCRENDKIKATSQYGSSDALSPEYFKHLAQHVAEAKKKHGSMDYHVVVASPKGDKPRAEDERVKAFKNANIGERLIIRGVPHPWPFEVLIGGHSMIIALLGGDKEARYEVGIKITDPEFVEKAAEWYGATIWESAKKSEIHH